MRYLPLYVLVAISGCIHSTAKWTAWTNAAEQQRFADSPTVVGPHEPAVYPVVAGEVEGTLGEGREIIAPPGSATAGSKWIEHAITYKNKSGRAIWVVGYSEDSPFAGIETRTNDAAGWRDYGLGYCGTGAREFEIAPGASHSFTEALPEEYVGEEFRVVVPYRTERAGGRWVRAVSPARRLDRPAGDGRKSE